MIRQTLNASLLAGAAALVPLPAAAQTNLTMY